MPTLLLDTNLVSYRMKHHTLATLYEPHLQGHELAISFMTVAELLEGAFRAAWDSTKLGWLEEALTDYRIIHSSPEICRRWGEIRALRFQQPISVPDAWIAATALANHWPLVTHNCADFHSIPSLHIITEPARS